MDSSLRSLVLTRSSLTGVLSVALILVACSAQTTSTTASSAPTTAVTTSTTVAPSTSTSTAAVVASPADICGPGISSWEAGETYLAPCFLTPIQFTPVDVGWSSIRADTEWVEGMWTEPDERRPAIRFVVLAYEPQSTPDEVIETILAIESVEPLTEPADDGERLSVDVATGPDVNPTLDRECMATLTRAFDLLAGDLGTVLLDRLNVVGGDGRAYGMGACWTFRIWKTTVADTTITVIATTADLDRFDELMPVAEQLVATIESAGS